MTQVSSSSPSKITLDERSIRLVRSSFTAWRYRKAADSFQSELAAKPVKLHVRSIGEEKLDGYIKTDEAIATITKPDGKEETQVFSRELGLFGFLESPRSFLRRVVQTLSKVNNNK